jgi:hypothetical protein
MERRSYTLAAASRAPGESKLRMFGAVLDRHVLVVWFEQHCCWRLDQEDDEEQDKADEEVRSL